MSLQGEASTPTTQGSRAPSPPQCPHRGLPAPPAPRGRAPFSSEGTPRPAGPAWTGSILLRGGLPAPAGPAWTGSILLRGGTPPRPAPRGRAPAAASREPPWHRAPGHHGHQSPPTPCHPRKEPRTRATPWEEGCREAFWTLRPGASKLHPTSTSNTTPQVEHKKTKVTFLVYTHVKVKPRV